MKQKLIRDIHRDFGYFYVGLIVSFAFSGILMNHREMWHPEKYTIETQSIEVKLPEESQINDEYAENLAKELGIPEGTIHTWLKAVRTGQLDIGEGAHTPESAMSLAEELTMLRKRVKDQDKEIRRLKEENEFLEEASAFFAASRRKSLRAKE